MMLCRSGDDELWTSDNCIRWFGGEAYVSRWVECLRCSYWEQEKSKGVCTEFGGLHLKVIE